jgi:anti-sigma regulatory factor (Ser/Thr protein kinase)
MTQRAPDLVTGSRSDAIELRLMARAENLALVRLALSGIATDAGAPEEVVADLKLVVTEACTNAIQHAYRDGDGADEIVVRYTLGEGALSIDVEDTGCGFSAEDPPLHEPNGDGPGNGLGLMIIRELTDASEVETGPTGTRISFTRRIS